MSNESNVQAMGQQPLLSACLIVKNEEEYLDRCLTSLKGLVDEIVLVDTGSEDRTVEIAESHGAIIYHEEWQDDFSLHRNQSLDRANGVWAFVCDADEELFDTDVGETRWQLDGNVTEPVVAVHEKLLLPDGTSLTLMAPRIVRRDSGIRYQFPIHEQLDSAENFQVSGSNINVLHHGYGSFDHLCRKQERNLAIAKTMGDHPHGLHCQARALLSLDRYTETVEVCRKLAATKYSEVYTLEASGVGASAAIRLGDRQSLREFIAIGKECADNSPDVALMEFLEGGYHYLEVLQENGLDDGAELTFLRPLVFRHHVPTMNKLLDLFASRKATVRL